MRNGDFWRLQEPYKSSVKTIQERSFHFGQPVKLVGEQSQASNMFQSAWGRMSTISQISLTDACTPPYNLRGIIESYLFPFLIMSQASSQRLPGTGHMRGRVRCSICRHSRWNTVSRSVLLTALPCPVCRNTRCKYGKKAIWWYKKHYARGAEKWWQATGLVSDRFS